MLVAKFISLLLITRLILHSAPDALAENNYLLCLESTLTRVVRVNQNNRATGPTTKATIDEIGWKAPRSRIGLQLKPVTKKRQISHHTLIWFTGNIKFWIRAALKLASNI